MTCAVCAAGFSSICGSCARVAAVCSDPAEMTGSVGVVTINMPRIGYLAKTKEDFFSRLGGLMDIAKMSLEIKRKVVEKNIEQGLLPFTKRYLPSLNNHFLTIGLDGMNEACLNF